MNRIKKTIATLALAGTLAVTGGTAVQLATSPNTSTAEAYTYTRGPEKWQHDRIYSGGRYYCGVWAYVDYNWWEESWMGGSHRDGWQRLYWAYC